MNASPEEIMLIKWLKKLQKELKCYGDLTIYNTFVLPHFDYCALVWNNFSKTLQNKFFKIKPVELSREIPIKLIQTLSNLNFLGTLRNQKGETTRNLYDSNNER